MSFEAFVARLAAEVDLTCPAPTRAADLADDWGLDSLDLFRALALTDARGRRSLLEPSLRNLRLLQDLRGGTRVQLRGLRELGQALQRGGPPRRSREVRRPSLGSADPGADQIAVGRQPTMGRPHVRPANRGAIGHPVLPATATGRAYQRRGACFAHRQLGDFGPPRFVRRDVRSDATHRSQSIDTAPGTARRGTVERQADLIGGGFHSSLDISTES